MVAGDGIGDATVGAATIGVTGVARGLLFWRGVRRRHCSPSLKVPVWMNI